MNAWSVGMWKDYIRPTTERVGEEVEHLQSTGPNFHLKFQKFKEPNFVGIQMRNAFKTVETCLNLDHLENFKASCVVN